MDILVGVILYWHILGAQELDEIASEIGENFNAIKGIHAQIVEKIAELQL